MVNAAEQIPATLTNIRNASERADIIATALEASATEANEAIKKFKKRKKEVKNANSDSFGDSNNAN